MPGDQIYMDAFDELATTRQFEGGPIPIDKILWYSVDYMGITDVYLIDVITAIIREMDLVYMKWVTAEREKKHKREMKKPQSPSSGAAKPRARRR